VGGASKEVTPMYETLFAVAAVCDILGFAIVLLEFIGQRKGR